MALARDINLKDINAMVSRIETWSERAYDGGKHDLSATLDKAGDALVDVKRITKQHQRSTTTGQAKPS